MNSRIAPGGLHEAEPSLRDRVSGSPLDWYGSCFQMGWKNSGSNGSNHGIIGGPWGTYSQRNMSEVMQSLMSSA